MGEWTALYYPNVEPPITWLRSAALLFDSITSFVPGDSKDDLSPVINEFSDATDGAWKPYRPTEETALLVDVPVDRLNLAFETIAAKRKINTKTFEFEFQFDGGEIRIKDHVFMHGSKLSPTVRKTLLKYKLILPKSLTGPLIEGDWWAVDEIASDLILSYISDKLALKKGWISITDNENCYTFNSLDADHALPNSVDAGDELARLLVRELIPEEVELLDIKKYVKLRNRYKPIREQLSIFIDDAISKNRFAHISDMKELQENIEKYVKGLSDEIQNFKQSSFGRVVRKWGTFTLGSFVTIAATIAAPQFALPIAGASIMIGAVDKSGALENKPTIRNDMIRLIAGARKEIIRSV
jgi:hypothetical protein